MYDIIIVGAGPAGLTAALYALRSGKSVLVLEAETIGGQITMSPLVENYPGKNAMSGIEFSDTLMDQVTELGGEIELERVLEIKDGDTKTVVTEYGEYQAKSVIIAVGAKHRALGIENEENLIGHGISYCAVCDGAFYAEKEVAVCGGGSSALVDALYLAGICKKVYLIHRRDAFRAEESLVKKVEAKGNIELVLDAVVEKLIGDNALEAIGVRKKNGETLEFSVPGLIVMIGMEPQNEPFKSVAELDESGYFDATETCRTKTDGIFIAGDCRKKSVRQLTTATADGTVAAVAACEYIDSL